MKPEFANASESFRRRNMHLFGVMPGARPSTPAPTRSEQSEAEIQDEIEAWLKGFGTACYYVRSRMDKPTTNAVGTPDFTGWLRGRPFALEAKVPGRKETREQAGALMWAKLAGATVAVVHSVEEAKAALLGDTHHWPEHHE